MTPNKTPHRLNDKSEPDRKASQRLIMSVAAAVICAILSFLSYRDGMLWQVPLWLVAAIVLLALPLLPQTRGHQRLLQASRWLVAAMAIGVFISELIRRQG